MKVLRLPKREHFGWDDIKRLLPQAEEEDGDRPTLDEYDRAFKVLHGDEVIWVIAPDNRTLIGQIYHTVGELKCSIFLDANNSQGDWGAGEDGYIEQVWIWHEHGKWEG